MALQSQLRQNTKFITTLLVPNEINQSVTLTGKPMLKIRVLLAVYGRG